MGLWSGTGCAAVSANVTCKSWGSALLRFTESWTVRLTGGCLFHKSLFAPTRACLSQFFSVDSF